MDNLTNKAGQDKIDLQALTESEARFRSIVLWSPDAIIVTDARGKIEYMNPAAEGVFNRKLESFVGQDLGLPLVDGERTEIDIFRPGKEPGVGDMHMVEAEWLNKKAHLITIRDISERKRAEEELRESARQLKESQRLGRMGGWEYNVASQKIIWSDQTYQLYKRDQALGPPTAEEEASYYSPEQAKELRDYTAKAIETGQGFDYDLEAKLPNGKTASFSATMQPIKDASDRVVKLVGTVHDITERKRTEEKLKKKMADLEIFYKAAMDREDKILELKKRVAELEKGKD